VPEGASIAGNRLFSWRWKAWRGRNSGTDSNFHERRLKGLVNDEMNAMAYGARPIVFADGSHSRPFAKDEQVLRLMREDLMGQLEDTVSGLLLVM
jgi:hypothetical protein